MRGFEQERNFEEASQGKIAELYGLVQHGLDEPNVGGDDATLGASFGEYTKSGLYLGFVDIEAVNPTLPGNRTGLCATVHIGNLAEGVPLGIEDVEARTNLDHVIKNYYIYYDGPRLKIVKSTYIKKPAEIDTKTEIEDLIELNNPLESLTEVYGDELEEVIEVVKKALGIDADNEVEDLPQDKSPEKGWIRQKLASIIGRLSLGR